LNIQGKAYDNLKWLALIGLPALGTLYFALAGIWGLPAAEQVVGTIVAVDTFLGVVLKISQADLTKGTLQVSPNADGSCKVFNLELDGDPEQDLENANRVLFNVEHA
jgi:Putative phage holin Dp-1